MGELALALCPRVRGGGNIAVNERREPHGRARDATNEAKVQGTGTS